MNIRQNCKRLGEEPEQARWSIRNPQARGKAKTNKTLKPEKLLEPYN